MEKSENNGKNVTGADNMDDNFSKNLIFKLKLSYLGHDIQQEPLLHFQ